ncbi:MAG: flavodoxin family protein [Chloroflexota bacterium]
MMYILAIVGSPRPKGNTNYLVDQALDEAARLGATTEKIVVSEHKLNPCLAHTNCRSLAACLQKDDGAWMLDKFCSADGIILATPVYYYDTSAWLKTFIDRNYFLGRHGKKCKAKTVGMVVVSGGYGMEETVQSLHRFVNGSSFKAIAEDKRFIVTGIAVDLQDAKNDPQLTNQARELGKQLVASLR